MLRANRNAMRHAVELCNGSNGGGGISPTGLVKRLAERQPLLRNCWSAFSLPTGRICMILDIRLPGMSELGFQHRLAEAKIHITG